MERLRDAVAEVPWVLGYRRASFVEDGSGVDVVVTTADVGDLDLQIKASRRGAMAAERRRPDVAVIVVSEHYSDWQLERDIRETLSSLRAERKARWRGGRP
jgi:hypothetical protein